MTNHAKVAYYFPEAYEGNVTINEKTMTIIEVATLKELPPIFMRYGDWVITPEGLDCLTIDYTVEKDRLNEPDWINHMSAKSWVNMDDFRRALSTAKDMFAIIGFLDYMKTGLALSFISPDYAV
ncbi:MAG: hypothetical protein ABIL62_08845 [Planctomycetota bacterium]